MDLNQVTSKGVRYPDRKRIARGPGSGLGKTAGRGHKGWGQRSASVPLMLGMIAMMVALGLAESVVPNLQARSELAAAHFREPGAYAARILHGASRNRPATPPFDVPAAPAESWAYALGAAGVAVATAACGRYRTRHFRGGDRS